MDFEVRGVGWVRGTGMFWSRVGLSSGLVFRVESLVWVDGFD